MSPFSFLQTLTASRRSLSHCLLKAFTKMHNVLSHFIRQKRYMNRRTKGREVIKVKFPKVGKAFMIITDVFQHRHTLTITAFAVYFNAVPALTLLIFYSIESHDIHL